MSANEQLSPSHNVLLAETDQHLAVQNTSTASMTMSTRLASRWSARLVGFLVSLLFLVLINYAHFGVLLRYFWPAKPPVNRERCTCECWDTIFKGTYENGVGRYKHMYFNVTPQTLKMWTLTVAAVLLTYECVTYVIRVALRSKIRPSMFVLLLAVIHSHYYSWWVFIGYYNDDFYSQWWHQLVFTCSELLSTVLVLKQLDQAVALSLRLLLATAGIAAFHVLAAGKDQFVHNVLLRRGEFHQVYRDSALMVSDVVYLVVTSAELVRMWCCERRSRDDVRMFGRDVLFCLVVIFGLIAMLSYL
ncbi:Hypp8854 [Branchiostoma lanceolatum]|uniref:Hypp8854 protein n=1 Tax=Branchiostoma lanceolatum TaxID=7740 RepID=A0A8J9Z9X4_BRALA|nr:Hypp8854 [Branchiostoma lanceolatum]